MRAKKFAGIVILILAAAFLSAEAYAAPMIVEKSVEPKTLNAGDKATVSLEIKNPFNQEIGIKIADKNIFADNGLDIQCIEYKIPARSTAHLAYDPIELFAPGKYTLDPAKVTYMNPETQKEETASSNSIDVDVGGKSTGASQQAITTIYRCNGQSMTSTSYSSSGSPQQQQQNPNNNQNSQQQTPQTPSAYDKMQNSQMPQDTDALKREMQKQAEKEKKMNEDFAKEVAQNPEIQKMQKELADKGFSPKSQSVSAESNNTGSFEMNYTKPNGETAKIAGQMENGKMKDAYSQNSEDDKNIMQMLQNNSDYQKYEGELKKEGLSQMQPQIQKRNDTYTVTVPFNGAANISTNIEAVEPNVTNIANITALIANNTVQEVKLEKEDGKKQYMWMVLLILLAAAAYIVYKKYSTKKPIITAPEISGAPKPDYIGEAKSMLMRAKELFAEGKEKEAYALVSEAVRYYFSHNLGMKKELTASELVQHLRRAKFKYASVQKCLNMCALVEFAKYVPNNEDFGEIVELAEGAIKL